MYDVYIYSMYILYIGRCDFYKLYRNGGNCIFLIVKTNIESVSNLIAKIVYLFEVRKSDKVLVPNSRTPRLIVILFNQQYKCKSEV